MLLIIITRSVALESLERRTLIPKGWSSSESINILDCQKIDWYARELLSVACDKEMWCSVTCNWLLMLPCWVWIHCHRSVAWGVVWRSLWNFCEVAPVDPTGTSQLRTTVHISTEGWQRGPGETQHSCDTSTWHLSTLPSGTYLHHHLSLHCVNIVTSIPVICQHLQLLSLTYMWVLSGKISNIFLSLICGFYLSAYLISFICGFYLSTYLTSFICGFCLSTYLTSFICGFYLSTYLTYFICGFYLSTNLTSFICGFYLSTYLTYFIYGFYLSTNLTSFICDFYLSTYLTSFICGFYLSTYVIYFICGFYRSTYVTSFICGFCLSAYLTYFICGF